MIYSIINSVDNRKVLALNADIVNKTKMYHRPSNAVSVCKKCGEETNLFFHCETKDPLTRAAMISRKLNGNLCLECFGETPCGRGEHGKCATKKFTQLREG